MCYDTIQWFYDFLVKECEIRISAGIQWRDPYMKTQQCKAIDRKQLLWRLPCCIFFVLLFFVLFSFFFFFAGETPFVPICSTWDRGSFFSVTMSKIVQLALSLSITQLPACCLCMDMAKSSKQTASTVRR